MGRRRPTLPERLKTDTPFYAENCLKIRDKRGEVVPLVARPWQLRLDDALEAQRREGKPMRAIILKARKLGFSTWVQGKLIQRVTQFPNRNAVVVAHDQRTATALWQIGAFMWANLPDEPGIKPVRTGYAEGAFMKFGQPSRALRDKGDLGLNTILQTETAREVHAARGFDYHYVHGSEVAFWPHEEKLTSLLNAVPREEETLVVLESTAYGENFFKVRWDRAMAGMGSYVPIFSPWHEDPSYSLPFPDEEAREEFEAQVGSGEYGEGEPRLVEEFDCTLEQLNWRRFTIVDECSGKVDTFHQEFPSDPEEAFLSSGRKVFAVSYIKRTLDRARRTDPQDPRPMRETCPPPTPGRACPDCGGLHGPSVGVLRASGHVRRSLRHMELEVPSGTLWVPREATGFNRRHPFWRVWEHPVTELSEASKPPDERKLVGHYIAVLDPAEGEETAPGENAWHAISLWNHRTLEQVAEYRSRLDADEVAEELLLAALYWNRPWVVVEKTGGYGLSVIRKLRKEFGYSRLYKRPAPDRPDDREKESYGWSTDRATKPLIEDGMAEVLRQSNDGIRSGLMAGELNTYIKDARGRTGPGPGSHSDLLMTAMIFHQVAREKRVPPDRERGAVDTRARPVRDRRVGY